MALTFFLSGCQCTAVRLRHDAFGHIAPTVSHDRLGAHQSRKEQIMYNYDDIIRLLSMECSIDTVGSNLGTSIVYTTGTFTYACMR